MNSFSDTSTSTEAGDTLADLPKSNIFTKNLPADAKFASPADSYRASREELGPRMVKNAIFTYVRPEEKKDAVLYGVSHEAMRDIGLREGEEKTQAFKDLVAGNSILWDPETQEGIYPWAQLYGGWQFGQWAGQLGDGRAISLFESTNRRTSVRYEWQLKGAGLTPYSRFADGKAVVRSSVREFVVSEALNGLGIPTTRALALTLTPETKVRRETMEPGAIVCRFAQSWLRIGNFDILHARHDRKLIRRLCDYLAEHVMGGWDKLPSHALSTEKSTNGPTKSAEANEEPSPPLEKPVHLNRYALLYRHIVCLNAKTVAAWQAYGFTNGVLNTDNTSLLGLSLDFGPFAFLDTFDPAYTPNHDDHMLRYAYQSQPSIIWWNLVRLGESLGELLGAGPRVDDEEFVNQGVAQDWAPTLIARAESIITGVGREYQQTFLAEYKRLMTKRLGLREFRESDFEDLFSTLLDAMADLELDFSHFFRRLSSVNISELQGKETRRTVARRFFPADKAPNAEDTNDVALTRVADWLDKWSLRVQEDWSDVSEAETARQEAMRAVNPNFVARGWVLEEVIRRVQDHGDKDILTRIMRMAANPFREHWATDDEVDADAHRQEEQRWCGDVPRQRRDLACSCSS